MTGRDIDIGRRTKLAGGVLAAVLAVGFVGLIALQLNADDTETPTGQVGAVDTGDRFYLGDADAPVTVVEFADFKCPHCGNFESQHYEQLKEEYIDTGDVKFYYYHLPVTGQQAQVAAFAAECVAEQDEDAFWDYKSALFERQDEQWQDLGYFVTLADDVVGDTVDTDQMQSCLEQGDVVSTMQDHMDLAEEHGVRSTPTFIVNGEMVAGNDYETLTDTIEGQR